MSIEKEEIIKRPSGYYNPADENGRWTAREGDMFYDDCDWVSISKHDVGCKFTDLEGARPIAKNIARNTAKILPEDPAERKKYPIVTGVLDYFPRTIAALARCSYEGNKQHNPGQPLHWDRSKSTDDLDALGRHLLDRQKMDGPAPEMVKVVWRAMAACEKMLEKEAE